MLKFTCEINKLVNVNSSYLYGNDFVTFHFIINAI